MEKKEGELRLVFNVGIAGNRKIDDNEKKIVSLKLKEILRYIKEKADEIKNNSKKIYSNDKPLLRLISSLAEGSDRIAAEIALDEKLGYKLQCPLPMSEEDFKKDFYHKDNPRLTKDSIEEFNKLIRKADSIFQLDFGRNIKPQCYLNAGLTMLEHSDVLIAVWDKNKSKGIGGTGDIVRYAREREIPVIWIDRSKINNKIKNRLKNRFKERHKNSYKQKYDIRRYYNKKLKLSLKVISYLTYAHRYAAWEDRIKKYMEDVLTPQMDSNEKFSQILTCLHNESIAKGKYLRAYSKLYSRFINSVSWTYHKENKSGDYISVVKQVRSVYDKDEASYVKPIIDNYLKADNLAIYFADMYRSAGLLRGIFPFLGAGGLLVATYWNFGSGTGVVKSLGFFLQAVFLLFTVGLSWLNKKLQWHKKFTDYRIIAESLRILIFIMPIGYTSREIRGSCSGFPWYKWYLRNFIRTAGLPDIKINRNQLKKYLQCVIDQFIKGQIVYHKEKAAMYGRINKRLSKLANLFFVLGVCTIGTRAIIYYLIQYGIMPDVFWGINFTYVNGLIITIFTVLGTLLFSVLGQSGFENLQQKNELIKSQLEELDKTKEYIGETYTEISSFILMVGELAINEVSEWRVFVKSKEIKKN